MNKKFWGLMVKKTGVILSLEIGTHVIDYGDGHIVSELTYDLEEYQSYEEHPIWMLSCKESVEKVKNRKSKNRKWYDSSYEDPLHRYKSDELEVVEICVSATKVLEASKKEKDDK